MLSRLCPNEFGQHGSEAYSQPRLAKQLSDRLEGGMSTTLHNQTKGADRLDVAVDERGHAGRKGRAGRCLLCEFDSKSNCFYLREVSCRGVSSMELWDKCENKPGMPSVGTQSILHLRTAAPSAFSTIMTAPKEESSRLHSERLMSTRSIE